MMLVMVMVKAMMMVMIIMAMTMMVGLMIIAIAIIIINIIIHITIIIIICLSPSNALTRNALPRSATPCPPRVLGHPADHAVAPAAIGWPSCFWSAYV